MEWSRAGLGAPGRDWKGIAVFAPLLLPEGKPAHASGGPDEGRGAILQLLRRPRLPPQKSSQGNLGSAFRYFL